jgi:hypothetical protein
LQQIAEALTKLGNKLSAMGFKTTEYERRRDRLCRPKPGTIAGFSMVLRINDPKVSTGVRPHLQRLRTATNRAFLKTDGVTETL